MKQNIADDILYEILGTELTDSDIIDSKIEQAYAIIRKQDKETAGKRARAHKKTKFFIGLGSVAAVILLSFTFCVMNPVMASELPIVGSLFAKVADVFRFGEIPEEKAETLYKEEAEILQEEKMKVSNQEEADSVKTESIEAESNQPYQVTQGDITVTLEEEYVSNQAIFIGIRIENTQEFPEMAAFVESGTQWLDVRTKEDYPFRPEQIMTRRRIEGKFEDAHTFIGIMRIDYSEISVDDSRYHKAIEEADEKGEEYPEINNLTRNEWFDYYEIPDSFDMTLEITQIIGTLKNTTRPEGMKSEEELASMSDEEFAAYRSSLPKEWVGYPNVYQHWIQDGSFRFTIPITQTDSVAKVISVNEVNEAGFGIESIEISTMELTLNTIEKTTEAMWTVVFDADGEEIKFGGDNDVYVTAGHDISTISVYICRFDDWEEAKTERENTGDVENFRKRIEACALFGTKIDTIK
ncbi:MAG: DUF4179 domain-containing protein [Bacillus sp. (in: Bacteria)]|nr:DUF4179 domain-containing protein [Bacillus sp. (in: firmicutes)]MCM1427569.1 DUF4179 domain-containing protein [Eubacterium sp.]